MSLSENKASVVRLLQAGTTFESVVNQVVSDDCEVINVVSTARGRAEFLQSRDALEAAFASLEIIVDEIVAEDDKVVVQSTWTGTHQGTFFGIASTSRTIHWTVVIFVRFRDGQIIRWWSLVDRFALLQQLSAQDFFLN